MDDIKLKPIDDAFIAGYDMAVEEFESIISGVELIDKMCDPRVIDMIREHFNDMFAAHRHDIILSILDNDPDYYEDDEP